MPKGRASAETSSRTTSSCQLARLQRQRSAEEQAPTLQQSCHVINLFKHITSCLNIQLMKRSSPYRPSLTARSETAVWRHVHVHVACNRLNLQCSRAPYQRRQQEHICAPQRYVPRHLISSIALLSGLHSVYPLPSLNLQHGPDKYGTAM